MKNILPFLLAAVLLFAGTPAFAANRGDDNTDMVIGAYVFRSERGIPDPGLVTHVNFAFAHVNETFDGVYIPDKRELRKVARLGRGRRAPKVLLSIGGWGSGRFSEMAATPGNRLSFAKACRRVVRRFRLAGIDIDWEYPTSDAAGISASPEDTENFTLLMECLRKTLGDKKMLTIATVCSARYIDLKAVLPYVDYVNVMAYDMGNEYTYQEAVAAHVAAGVPPGKLVLGMPFHEGKDVDGTAERCDYIIRHNLRGGMYWEWNCEQEDHAMAEVCSEKLRVARSLKNVLVLYENGGWHKPLTDVLVPWLDSVSASHGFAVTDIRNTRNVSSGFLNDYDVILQLDCPPYPWPEEAQNAFMDYIREGRGGYAGFHHATLLGEFDGFPMWDWFSDFMGGIRFDNYIAGTCSGTVNVEDASHPAMSRAGSSFIVDEDEWYTYDKSPRAAPYIHVIASVDEDSYSPASRIRMGDHPVVWTNTSVKAKNIYFQFGHSPVLMQNETFLNILLDTIEWLSND